MKEKPQSTEKCLSEAHTTSKRDIERQYTSWKSHARPIWILWKKQCSSFPTFLLFCCRSVSAVSVCVWTESNGRKGPDKWVLINQCGEQRQNNICWNRSKPSEGYLPAVSGNIGSRRSKLHAGVISAPTCDSRTGPFHCTVRLQPSKSKTSRNNSSHLNCCLSIYWILKYRVTFYLVLKEVAQKNESELVLLRLRGAQCPNPSMDRWIGNSKLFIMIG